MIARLFVQLCLVTSLKAKIYWNLTTNPVVLGSDVVLFCNTTQALHDCYACLNGWHGGPDNSIISLDEYTINSEKYIVSANDEGFSLTIRHFDVSDANKEYSCSHGFHSFKMTLILDESTLNLDTTGIPTTFFASTPAIKGTNVGDQSRDVKLVTKNVSHENNNTTTSSMTKSRNRNNEIKDSKSDINFEIKNNGRMMTTATVLQTVLVALTVTKLQ